MLLGVRRSRSQEKDKYFLFLVFTVTSHQSPVTSHQSPVTSHQSPVISPLTEYTP
ncbi:MAG: hypothetical protein ACKO9I_08355 [Sphaerospermopsis kisseleviana]